MIKDGGIYRCKHFKDEKSFTTWFGQELRKAGGFWHKISDSDSRLKPCDAIAVLDGESYLIEFKIGDERARTDVYKKMRPNQLAGLRRVAEAGGNALVIYYSRFYDIYCVRGFFRETKELVIDLSKEIII